MKFQYIFPYVFVGLLISGMALFGWSFYIFSETIKEDTTIIQYKLDKISRFKMCDSTVIEATKTTGLYSDNQMIAVWVENRDVDDIHRTVWHELAHHNVTLSKKGISMEKFVCDDLQHFCKVNVSDCYSPILSHK